MTGQFTESFGTPRDISQDQVDRMKDLNDYKCGSSISKSADIVDKLIIAAIRSRFPNSTFTSKIIKDYFVLENTLSPIRDWLPYSIKVVLYSLSQQDSPFYICPESKLLVIPLTLVTRISLSDLSNEIDRLTKEDLTLKDLSKLSQHFAKYRSLFVTNYPLEVPNLYLIRYNILNSMRTLKDLGKYLPLESNYSTVIQTLMS